MNNKCHQPSVDNTSTPPTGKELMEKALYFSSISQQSRRKELRVSLKVSSNVLKMALLLRIDCQELSDNTNACADKDKIQLSLYKFDESISYLIKDISKSWARFNLTNQ